MTGDSPSAATGDAFGQALLDYQRHGAASGLTLELDDGWSTPAMEPAWFFLGYDHWPAQERAALGAITVGPVLDLGCGAGRHALYLQDRGHTVTAVDASPGAVAVCRARGVRDVRLGDLTDPPADRRCGAVLLMCGNLGLAGDWDATRALLGRLAAICAPDAVLVGDTVDPTITEDPHHRAYQHAQRAAGRHVGQVRLRLRYGDIATPWWEQINVPVAEVAALIDGTGWRLASHLLDGADHYVVLQRLR